MRGGTVQINWHDSKPVLACDFHPISALLATAGADYDIKIWATVSSSDQKKAPGVAYQSNLSYHSSAVNALRFSPSGDQLASGADGGELILWKLNVTDAGEVWKVHKSLVFHRKDVLDLQWSADGAYLITGSVDNSCIIWDANKGSVHQILDAHFHYVQGVAWDPLGKYAASFSSDRTCRIYVNKPSKAKGVERSNYVCQHVISKAELPVPDESKSARSHLFLDETLPSFFRRLAWSPDGSFLLVPAGTHKSTPTSELVNTAYVFSRKDLQHLTSPIALYLLSPSDAKTCILMNFQSMVDVSSGSASVDRLFCCPFSLQYYMANYIILIIYDKNERIPALVAVALAAAALTAISASALAPFIRCSRRDYYFTLCSFLNGSLEETIYMEQPEGYCPDESCVYKKVEESYIDTIVKRFSMQDSKKGFLPFSHGITLSQDMCPKTPIEIEEIKVEYLTRKQLRKLFSRIVESITIVD
ncbi:hypothetical protein SASPL_118191 [Salvia splendens]|uniref:CAF-1 p60 homolog n=1 Tax=Salvia splendens TaxID=180675 RepID=A0A8X8ZZN3_SALSN|nr:hypothetical protein SASPL_118191 [Salvia splendens]